MITQILECSSFPKHIKALIFILNDNLDSLIKLTSLKSKLYLYWYKFLFRIMESQNQPKQGYKKKKKRSFLQNAKKFGKQGTFGKGRRLSQEEYNYYIRVLEELRSLDESEKCKWCYLYFIKCNDIE